MFRQYKKGALSCVVFLLLAGLMHACSAPAPPVTEPTAAGAVRQRLRPTITDVDVSRDQAVVQWQVDRSRADVIRGYNVYVSSTDGLAVQPLDSPQLAAALYNQSTYPGDTDGDISTESIVLDRLETGQRYYVHVRTVFPDGRASPPSSEFAFMPRPQGVLTLYPRLSGNTEGFSFAADTAVEWTSLLNDVYLYVVRDTAFLASPSRLDGGLRDTRFVNLGRAEDFSAYPEISSERGDGKVALREDQVIGVRLDDDRIAKLRVVAIRDDADPLAVTFEYRYQPVAGETLF